MIINTLFLSCNIISTHFFHILCVQVLNHFITSSGIDGAFIEDLISSESKCHSFFPFVVLFCFRYN